MLAAGHHDNRFNDLRKDVAVIVANKSIKSIQEGAKKYSLQDGTRFDVSAELSLYIRVKGGVELFLSVQIISRYGR